MKDGGARLWGTDSLVHDMESECESGAPAPDPQVPWRGVKNGIFHMLDRRLCQAREEPSPVQDPCARQHWLIGPWLLECFETSSAGPT